MQLKLDQQFLKEIEQHMERAKALSKASGERKLTINNYFCEEIYESTFFTIINISSSRVLYYYDPKRKMYSANLSDLIETCAEVANLLITSSQIKSVTSYLTKKVERCLINGDKSRVVEYKPLKVGELPLKNGIYNALTKKFVPYSHEITNINKMDVNYNKDVKRPDYNFNQFIREFCGYNENKVKELYQILRTLIFNPNSGKMFIIQGNAGDGKSTFFGKFFGKLMGEENVASITLSQLNEPDKLVNLAGKRVAIGDDNDGTLYVKKVGIVKSIATKGYISVTRKYLDSLTFIPDLHMVQLVNSYPRFEPSDKDAIKRRIVVFGVNNQFTKSKTDDKSIANAFTTDFLEDALNCLLDDKVMPFRSDFDLTDSKMLFDTINNNDDIASFLEETIEDETSVFNNEVIPKILLYSQYKVWCDENLTSPLSSKSFFLQAITKLDELGYSFYNKQVRISTIMHNKELDFEAIKEEVKDESKLDTHSRPRGYFRKDHDVKVIAEVDETIKDISITTWLKMWENNVLNDNSFSKKEVNTPINKKVEMEIELEPKKVEGGNELNLDDEISKKIDKLLVLMDSKQLKNDTLLIAYRNDLLSESIDLLEKEQLINEINEHIKELGL